MGTAFHYCPAIVENALFYLDCYITSAIGEGKAVLTKEKFQVTLRPPRSRSTHLFLFSSKLCS